MIDRYKGVADTVRQNSAFSKASEQIQWLPAN